MSEKKSTLQRIRKSPLAQAVDKAIEATDKFLGPSGKAWVSNGFQELQQVFTPGLQQIQAVSSPGTFGTITTGEATAERMADKDHDVPTASYEVPKQETTLAKMRGYEEHAKEKTQEAMERMDKKQERGIER
jgi:hypothetical protein